MFLFIFIIIALISSLLYNPYIQLYSKYIFKIRNSLEHSENLIPRGGGIIFGITNLILIYSLYNYKFINNEIFLPLFLVSLGCLSLGFLDDLFHLKIKTKFFFQFLISIFIVEIFKDSFQTYFPYFNKYFVFMFFSIFFIWVLNAANFLDGSDGHLTILVILQNLTLLLVQLFSVFTSLYIYNIILIITLIIFFWFNRFPAKVYMGDAGSLFLGGVQLTLFLIFLFIFKLNIFILLIIFSYFILETSGTLFFRLMYNKKIFNRHQSHSYQKFVEIYGHKNMIRLLIAFYILWIIPLILLSVFLPDINSLICLISFIPSLFFLLKFGLPGVKN